MWKSSVEITAAAPSCSTNANAVATVVAIYNKLCNEGFLAGK